MPYRGHFSHALAAAPERLHFAAHSHHLWPDVTRAAHARAWDDAAALADLKWERVFGELLPAVRRHVARILGLSDPATIAVAQSTHELVQRVISCFEGPGPVRVLTTDAEFHSFRRQCARLEEAGRLAVERVPAEPFVSFPERFARAAARGHDLVYLSHVFYNSGYVVPDLRAIVEATRPEAFVVIDGYHGFCAVPTSLAALEERVFYVAGGYKYAMSGEGACFLHCPPGRGARPLDTGWFAGFGALAGEAEEAPVGYAADGSRFLGSTFDPSGLYRFRAAMDWLQGLDLCVAEIHAHVAALQGLFLGLLAERPLGELSLESLLPPSTFVERGHFLTFRTPRAGEIQRRLLEAGVVTDHRHDRLRFGFGLYHGEQDVHLLHGHLARLLG